MMNKVAINVKRWTGGHGFTSGVLIATDEELGGAPSEGVDVASSSFPSITNRGLSNQ